MNERPFERDALVAAFTEHDEQVNEDGGPSESADSGRLGWGAAGWLDAYIKLYDATDDRTWLDRIARHGTRILAHRADHFGDGGATWVTPTYSVGRIEAAALHNRGSGDIQTPTNQVWFTRGGDQVKDAQYLVEASADRRLRIQRLPSRSVEAEVAYGSGREIDFFRPFGVVISGRLRPGDAFHIRTCAPGPVEYIVHQGNILHPLALFVQRVRRNADLKDRYGETADAFLQAASALAARHERFWMDTGRGAGAYRFTASSSERFPNRILPHNQYLALSRAFLVLSAVCRRQRFPDRAVRMARNFKRALQRTGQAYTWHYWDWVENGEPDHSAVEDTSHGHLDVGFAIDACRRGVVFRNADLRRFAATLTTQMWNGSLETPTIGGRVNTREGDVHTIRDWIDLCQWEPRIWSLYWALFNRLDQPARDIPSILQGWDRMRQGRADRRKGGSS